MCPHRPWICTQFVLDICISCGILHFVRNRFPFEPGPPAHPTPPKMCPACAHGPGLTSGGRRLNISAPILSISHSCHTTRNPRIPTPLLGFPPFKHLPLSGKKRLYRWVCTLPLDSPPFLNKSDFHGRGRSTIESTFTHPRSILTPKSCFLMTEPSLSPQSPCFFYPYILCAFLSGS
jgi:hypothetical protein